MSQFVRRDFSENRRWKFRGNAEIRSLWIWDATMIVLWRISICICKLYHNIFIPYQINLKIVRNFNIHQLIKKNIFSSLFVFNGSINHVNWKRFVYSVVYQQNMTNITTFVRKEPFDNDWFGYTRFYGFWKYDKLSYNFLLHRIDSSTLKYWYLKSSFVRPWILLSLKFFRFAICSLLPNRYRLNRIKTNFDIEIYQ